MFASRSVVEHLARGVVGVGAFTLAVSLAPSRPIFSILFIALAIVALRGCPLCWTLGLAQTVLAKLRGRSATEACVDGRCAATERHLRR